MQKKMAISRYLLALILVLGLLLGENARAFAQDSWAVYLYMCGSDLESNNASATDNLREIQKVVLPDNVKVIIQTGGALKWHTPGISSESLGRYVYDSGGLQQVAVLPNASMGDRETLQGFLRFAQENYPADHRMLVFWNHGGGSLVGFCQDERYGNSLSLGDLRAALTAVAGNSTKPAFDVVCFDTCLMATLETASALQGYTRYLVASQEIMPENGIDYASWLGAVAQNPAIEGRELGRIICDTYMTRCQQYEAADMANMSVLDMEKLPALQRAYERMGREALQQANEYPLRLFTGMDRVANSVENYGPNSDDEYWTNMIDLGSLAAGMEDLESSLALQKAVEDAVCYRVAGKYRRYGMGLSCYYSLDGSIDSVRAYSKLPQASKNYQKLYTQMLATDEQGQPLYQFDLYKLMDVPVSWDEDNMPMVQVDPDDANAISAASCIVTSWQGGEEVVLGSDAKVYADWDMGVFKCEFAGQWPQLNGHVLPMNMVEAHPDYYLYYSSVLLNGRNYYLVSAYDEDKAAFEILGARRVMHDGVPERDLRQLKLGDRITPIFHRLDGSRKKGPKFTLTGRILLEDAALPDGHYNYYFNFEAPRNESVTSLPVTFKVTAGEVVPEN